MEKLGAAIIGTGWVSDEHIKAYRKDPHTEVVAILSRDRARAEAKAREHGIAGCRAYTKLEELLHDDGVQVVSVCTPHSMHAEPAIACAETGRHILVEKPLAISWQDVKAIEKAVRKAGVRSQVSFVLRWNPLFENLKAMLRSGLFGRLYMAEVDYLSGVGRWYRGYEWIRRRETGGSNLLASGCHAVDAVRWFVGREVVEVFAYSNRSPSNRLQYEYDTNSITLMKFDDGTIGKTACSIESPAPYTFPVELMGDRGAARNNQVYTAEWPGQTGWATIPTVLPDTAEVTHHPFVAEIAHFLACIRGGCESHCNIADAARTHEICFASEISAREGRPVRLPL